MSTTTTHSAARASGASPIFASAALATNTSATAAASVDSKSADRLGAGPAASRTADLAAVERAAVRCNEPKSGLAQCEPQAQGAEVGVVRKGKICLLLRRHPVEAPSPGSRNELCDPTSRRPSLHVVLVSVDDQRRPSLQCLPERLDVGLVAMLAVAVAWPMPESERACAAPSCDG